MIQSVVTNESLIKTIRKVFTWSVTNGMLENGQKGKEETKVPFKE
ncbi:hypothetical protein V7150_16910 [Neobacillus drentensis]